MSNLSIKVQIGDRTYPLTIKREEEESLRKAAKMVNANMKKLEDNYAVRDKQDLLAMTALQYATSIVDGKTGSSDDESLITEIRAITELLAKG